MEVADLVPPQVTGSSITQDETDVSPMASISVFFDEAMSEETVNSATITLMDMNTGLNVTGDITLAANGKSATFTPQSPLEGLTSYELTVADSVADLAGNYLAEPFTMSFTTKPVEDVTIENSGMSSSPYVVSSGRYSNISITNSYVVFDGPVVADSVSLVTGSTLTHYSATTSTESKMEIHAASVTIDASSKIDVSRRGYLGGRRGGNSSDTGRRLGNTTSGGSTNSSGGSYGGLGGLYNNGGTSGSSYGSLFDPNELGGGGGGTR